MVFTNGANAAQFKSLFSGYSDELYKYTVDTETYDITIDNIQVGLYFDGRTMLKNLPGMLSTLHPGYSYRYLFKMRRFLNNITIVV